VKRNVIKKSTQNEDTNENNENNANNQNNLDDLITPSNPVSTFNPESPLATTTIDDKIEIKETNIDDLPV
jgi:hypothetical protein